MRLDRLRDKSITLGQIRIVGSRRARAMRTAERAADVEHEENSLKFRKLRDRLRRDLAGGL